VGLFYAIEQGFRGGVVGLELQYAADFDARLLTLPVLDQCLGKRESRGGRLAAPD
jgi:hypothetical protein